MGAKIISEALRLLVFLVQQDSHISLLARVLCSHGSRYPCCHAILEEDRYGFLFG